MPCSTSPSGCSRTPTSLALLRRVSPWVRDTGSAIGLSMSRVGTTYGPTGQPQPLERLRRGDLVDQVEVDEEEVRLPRRAPDDVLVPDFLAQGPAHDLSSTFLRLRGFCVGTCCRLHAFCPVSGWTRVTCRLDLQSIM